jgi:tetratricopeptide (TPR) repeat protein
LLDTSEDVARMAALAKLARESCADDSVDCAKVSAYASNVLSQLAAYAGDDATALAEMRRCADSAQRAFGEHHDDTAVAFVNLAVIARNGGRLQEADQAMRQAVAAAEGVRMRAADRVLMERTLAIIAHDQGRFAEARDRLRALSPQLADPEQRAVQLRILANIEVELGEGGAALAHADEALAVHHAHANAQAAHSEDSSNAEPHYARQARARALAVLARHDEALAEIDAAIAGLAATGSGADSFEILRAQRYRAEYLLAAGETEAAIQALRDLRARHQRAPLFAVERGLLLDVLGEAEQRAGRANESRTAHEAARLALAEQLGEAHPFMVRNAALRRGASH